MVTYRKQKTKEVVAYGRWSLTTEVVAIRELTIVVVFVLDLRGRYRVLRIFFTGFGYMTCQ